MSLRSALTVSVATSALAFAAMPAWAQEAVAPPAGAGTTASSVPPEQAAPAAAAPSPDGSSAASRGDIVVTGSRVARQGFDAPTPTVVLSSDLMNQRGATNVGDFLNELPSFRVSQSTQTNPQSSAQGGQVYADLRGLGSIRTLVLVDGRRHVPSAATGQVDINLVPTILVDRVEVVTGGASAAYGSDAVSGVVNIILDKKLQGFKGDVSSGISNYGDNWERRISLAFGTEFAEGRGHIVIGGDYVKSDGVDSYLDRDWGRRDDELITFGANRPAGTPSRLYASGVSYTSSPEGGVIIGPNADTNPANGKDVLRGIGFLPGGGTYAFNYGNDTGSGSAYNNTSKDGSFTRLGHALILPEDRHVVMTHLDYDLSSNLSFFVEGSYARSGATFNGPSPRDTNTTTIVIQRDNAYLPASVASIMAANNINSFSLGRANVDFAQSFPKNYNTTERIVGGLNGKLGGGWSWDAYYQYGRNVFDSEIDNIRIEQNFRFAYDAVVNPANGQVTCRALVPGSSTYNPIAAAGCVPVNLFGVGSPSAAAAAYINGTQFYKVTTTQEVAAANLRGNLFSTWAGPVAVAVGGEYRVDTDVGVVDALAQASAYNFSNPKAFSGSFNTKEGYVEALVPLAKDSFLAQSLDLNGAVRYTDYSSSGPVTTWKVGATWEPVKGFKLRATRSRDIRAPNASELFSVHERQLDAAEHLQRPDQVDPRDQRAERQPGARKGGHHHGRFRLLPPVPAGAEPVGRLLQHQHQGRDRLVRRTGVDRQLLCGDSTRRAGLFLQLPVDHGNRRGDRHQHRVGPAPQYRLAEVERGRFRCKLPDPPRRRHAYRPVLRDLYRPSHLRRWSGQWALVQCRRGDPEQGQRHRPCRPGRRILLRREQRRHERAALAAQRQPDLCRFAVLDDLSGPLCRRRQARQDVGRSHRGRLQSRIADLGPEQRRQGPLLSELVGLRECDP